MDHREQIVGEPSHCMPGSFSSQRDSSISSRPISSSRGPLYFTAPLDPIIPPRTLHTNTFTAHGVRHTQGPGLYTVEHEDLDEHMTQAPSSVPKFDRFSSRPRPPSLGPREARAVQPSVGQAPSIAPILSDPPKPRGWAAFPFGTKPRVCDPEHEPHLRMERASDSDPLSEGWRRYHRDQRRSTYSSVSLYSNEERVPSPQTPAFRTSTHDQLAGYSPRSIPEAEPASTGTLTSPRDRFSRPSLTPSTNPLPSQEFSYGAYIKQRQFETSGRHKHTQIAKATQKQDTSASLPTQIHAHDPHHEAQPSSPKVLKSRGRYLSELYDIHTTEAPEKRERVDSHYTAVDKQNTSHVVSYATQTVSTPSASESQNPVCSHCTTIESAEAARVASGSTMQLPGIGPSRRTLSTRASVRSRGRLPRGSADTVVKEDPENEPAAQNEASKVDEVVEHFEDVELGSGDEEEWEKVQDPEGEWEVISNLEY